MKFLIVDDDIISCQVIRQCLAEFAQVHICTNALAALDIFSKALTQNEPYALVTLDILMPDLNGQELLKKLRAIEQERGVSGAGQCKIMMISSLDDLENVTDALLDGDADVYVSKPITRDALREQLQKLKLI